MGSTVLDGSLWSRHLKGQHAPLADDRGADVVVIGAGIAGMLTATVLHESGHDVLVVDRDVVGGVATRNTTAKVTALQGTTLSKIAKARGPEAARSYAAAQVDAVDGLRGLIATLGIDCAMTAATAVTFALQPKAVALAAAEHNAALAAGLPVAWMASLDVPFATAGAVTLADQFHMNPADLCRGLAAHLGMGHIFEHTTVAGIDETKDGCVVTTDHGQRIHANHVVIATQAPIVDPLLVANRCRPMQSYAIAVRLDGPMPPDMYLSADDFTISLRPSFVDGERFLIVGGNGHPMGQGSTAKRWATLEHWTATNVGPGQVVHRWATHDLVATDHVPFIGRATTNTQRRWLATAFGKWGMSNAFVAARLLGDAIDGKDAAPWAATFDSTRIRSTVNREFLGAGKTAVEHLVIDRVARRPEPRCTHQGCVLRKDDELNTWDCPCHGSRFDDKGQVLQGPAINPIETP